MSDSNPTDKTEPASFYIWSTRALYLGTRPIPLREYTVSSDQLIVCLEGSIQIQLQEDIPPPRQENGEPLLAFRSVLLRAGTQVKMSLVDTQDAVVAICYLNPVGQDFQLLQAQATLEFEGAYYEFANEERLIQQLRYIRDNKLNAKDAGEILELLVSPQDTTATRTAAPVDSRIVKVMKRINTSLRDNLPISALAEEVYLSESRLVKLFKAEIGVPITKYRLRYRVFVGVIYMALGFSITEAAMAAGFSSTAHFSKCFSAMTGMPPSNKYLRPPYIRIILAEEIFTAVTEANSHQQTAL